MQLFISSTIFIFTALFKARVKGFGRLVVWGWGGGGGGGGGGARISGDLPRSSSSRQRVRLLSSIPSNLWVRLPLNLPITAPFAMHHFFV